MNTKVKWGGIDNTLIFKMQFSKEDAEEARDQYDQAKKLIKDINKGTADTVKLNKENLKIFTELLEKYEDLDLEIKKEIMDKKSYSRQDWIQRENTFS